MRGTAETDVLIIGAGPVGMTAAAVLAEYGVRCRIVDRRPGPATGTRCTNLWPATLDAMAFMGLDVGALVEGSQPMRHKVFHLGESSFSSDLTEYGAVSPVPLIQSQDVVDGMLRDRLAGLGVKPEYGIEATRVRADADGVTVDLVPAGDSGAVEHVRAGWLVAALGADGGTEELLGVRRVVREFPGVRVLHADARLRDREGIGPDEEHIHLVAARSAGFVPMPDGSHRLFMVAPHDGGPPPSAAEVVAAVAEVSGRDLVPETPGCPWQVLPVSRIAETFRMGRVLLVGGSATALPLTVHGMNNGMQDAVNLAWKLGMVVRGTGDERLLDSYTVERRRIARGLLEVTEKVLALGTREDSEATHAPRFKQGKVDMCTQPTVTYRESPLSDDHGRPEGPRAGDPMPGLYDPSGGDRPRCTEWTLLVPETCAGGPVPHAELRALANEHRALRLRVTAPGPAVHLVRPDGFVGFRGPATATIALRDYVARFLR
ncbi:FAD-dependent monooxygenase [Spirillospora sp. CA-294931]|uniref:FAD-dependent monooxygenase n=1 Tax=Spirillospora sp. CA-294931 TaxID=3240042 RepID=UPI003D8B80A6